MGTLGATEVGAQLEVLLSYERELAAQPLLEALLDRRFGDHPAEVRRSADRIVRSVADWALDVTASAARLIDAAGDERSVRLFRSQAIAGSDKLSLQDVAREEGISPQRVVQIVHRAGERVRGEVPATPPWPWLVSTLRRSVGLLTTTEVLESVLARLGVSASPGAELLAWLAGPYQPVGKRPGWVAVEPKTAVGRTTTCLASDGGVRRLPDVRVELADLEVTSDQLGAWLQGNGAVVVHDLAVLVTGRLDDAIERVLDAYGTGRTTAEIAAGLAAGGRTVEEGVLDRAFRSRRFTQAASGAIGLTSWGGEQPLPAGRRRQRPAKGNGAKSGRAPAKKVGEALSATARLWLWVKVDEEVLRGSEAAVPAALAEGLRLAPLSQRTFSSRWGPVTLGHDGPQPTRGSVRAVALAAGAGAGDSLLLGFSAAGDVAVEVRSGPDQRIPSGGTAATLVDLSELEFVDGGAP